MIIRTLRIPLGVIGILAAQQAESSNGRQLKTKSQMKCGCLNSWNKLAMGFSLSG